MLVCITGMHRSGTSLLARVVNLLGVEFGDSGALLPPGADNPKGYWERRDLVAIDDDVLRELGGSWREVPSLTVDWATDPRLEELRQKANALVRDLRPEAERHAGFKDPRCSLLLPFWRSVADVDEVVVAVRRPEGVAASLGRRNGMGLPEATALYVRYLASLLGTEPNPIVVDYEDLLRDPRTVASALSSRLGLPSPSTDVLARIEEFAAPDLNHAPAEPGDPGNFVLANELYQAALDPHRDRDWLSALHSALNEAVSDSGGAALEQELVERANERADRAMSRLRALEVETAFNAARRARWLYDSRVQQRKMRVDLAFSEARRLRSEHELDRRLAAVQVEMEFAEARRARRQLDGLVARDEAIAELKMQLDRTAAERSSVARQLERTARDYRRLKNRRSVRAATRAARVARPLFKAVRAVKKRGRSSAPTSSAPASGTASAPPPTPPDPPVPASTGPRAGTPTADRSRMGARRGTPSATDTETVTKRSPVRLSVDQLQRDVGLVSIIVPVYNAPDELARCVESVLKHTTYPAELVLIDDASTDPRVRPVLEQAEVHPGVRVLRNDVNLGFTRTVNRGLELTKGDVVLLNADAQVTPRWLQNLLAVAYQDGAIGTVTPVSDNAGAFSVPERGVANELAPSLDRDEVGRLITRSAARVRPTTPTGNGFCMYIKRALLDSVGSLDADAFPRGYGEENDLSMRATAAGWRHVVDDATIVFHHGSASFGAEKEELIARGLTILDERWPEYRKLVRPFLHGTEMTTVRERVADVLGSPPANVAPRILYVDHGTGGGVRAHIDALAGGLEEFEALLLASNGRLLTLSERRGGGWSEVETWELQRPMSVVDEGRWDYRAAVTDAILRFGVEVVHVHHLIRHSTEIVDVAKDLGLPVAISLHDYYLVCPTIQLLDEEQHFCGGRCTPGQGECRVAFEWIRRDVPHLKHAWVNSWQRRQYDVLAAADALVTFTDATLRVFSDVYPDLDAERLHVIPHGSDLPDAASVVSPPQLGEPLRVVVSGNLNAHKGTDLLTAVHELDVDGRIEFHLLGRVAPDVADIGIVHGAYEPAELTEKLRAIRPSLAAVLSPWGETFCFTLSEAWAHDIPVVAADVGALRERVREEGGGWLVSPDDPEGIYETFIMLTDDREEYDRVASQAAGIVSRPVGDMVKDYERLYGRLVDAASTLSRTPAPQTEQQIRS